jgi:hypothetical protein
MQSRIASAIESVCNVGSGFAIAWALTMYVLPLWGYTYTPKQSIEITLLYTSISLVRGYCWRRFFTGKVRA